MSRALSAVGFSVLMLSLACDDGASARRYDVPDADGEQSTAPYMGPGTTVREPGTGGRETSGTGGVRGTGGTGSGGATVAQDAGGARQDTGTTAGPEAGRDAVPVIVTDSGTVGYTVVGGSPKCVPDPARACVTRADCPRGNDCAYVGSPPSPYYCACFLNTTPYQSVSKCPSQPSHRKCTDIDPCDLGEYCSPSTGTCECP